MSRFRNWCFTLNLSALNHDSDVWEHPSTIWDYLARFKVRRGVASLECGAGSEAHPDGLLHFQGCFVLTTNVEVESIKNKCRPIGMWCEPMADKTGAKAQSYCEKGETNVEGPFYFGMKAGDKLLDQGHRSDLDAVVKNIQASMTIPEVAAASPNTFIRYGRGIMTLHSILCPIKPRDRSTPPSVTLLIGPSGCGKTRWVWDNVVGPLYCVPVRLGQGVWWFSGYSGQPNVLIDEVDKSPPPLSELLKLLDRYPYQVRTDGSQYVEFNSPNIFLTCNEPISMWYPEFAFKPAGAAGIERRITRRIQYGRPPDQINAAVGGVAAE